MMLIISYRKFFIIGLTIGNMIGIIDSGTSWLNEIKKNVSTFNKSYQVIKISDMKHLNFKYFSGIIISGAPILLTKVNRQKYIDHFKFVKTANIPVLGICLGHQIMGLVYGAKISAGKNIKKKEQIEIVRQDNLFQDIKTRALFKEEHSEFITLPKGFYLLAKSKTCNNEAMKHKHKRLYGVQFHPEVSNSNGKKILRNFLDMCS